MASRFHRLKVREVRRETADCVSVAFDVPAELTETFSFTAGQHLTLRAQIEGEDVRRSYSICTSPAENDLRVAIKHVEEGRFSTFANRTLSPEDELEVMPPAGRFFTPIEPDRAKQYLAIAAGSGITPIIALIKAILNGEPDSRVNLLYGNRNRGSIIFKEELARLKNRFVDRLCVYHVFSRERLETPLLEGRIDTAKLQQFFAGAINKDRIEEVFLCGPEAMMLALREFLMSDGFSQKQIHFELFGTDQADKAARQRRAATEREQEDDVLCQVSVKSDGAILDVLLRHAGDSILDAALQAGADLPYACKGGVCTTCKAQLEAGEVDMDVCYGLEPDEVAAGLILTCQSHPKTERVVVNYDIR